MASKRGPSGLPVGARSEPHDSSEEHGTITDTATKVISSLPGVSAGEDTTTADSQQSAASQPQTRLPLLSSIYNRILAFVPKIAQSSDATAADTTTAETVAAPVAESEDEDEAQAKDVDASSDEDEDEDEGEAGSEGGSSESESESEDESTENIAADPSGETSLLRLNATNDALQATIANLVHVVEEQAPADDSDDDSDSEAEDEDEDEESEDESSDEEETEQGRKRRRIGTKQGARPRPGEEVPDSDSESEEEESGAMEGRKRKR